MTIFTKTFHVKAVCFSLIILLNIVLSFSASAQCGTDEYWKWRASQNPSMYAERQVYDQSVDNAQKQYKTELSSTGPVRVIPVVFHIMHNYGPENVGKQHILDQLATMNRNYQKLNGDTISVRSVFKNLIANCRIEFRLATKDPNGNCTDGIERVQTTLTYSAEDNVKGLVQWDPKKYLNIWVVQTINLNLGLPPGYVVAGYSSFPTDNNLALDGIVVRSDQINSGSTTLTHECGHYFSLYHPFENSAGGSECGRNCNTTGDHVCDTPPTSSANYGCVPATNTCTSDFPDLPDMIEAFMDYSNCPHMFTLGESKRIDAALVNTRRASLYTSNNLAVTGTDSASQAAQSCAAPKADFFTNTFVVCRGGSISFTDNSYNAAVTAYNWTIPNATPVSPSSNTSPSPTFTFPDTGYYSVTLRVSNSNGSSQAQKTSYIHVVSEKSPVKTITEDFENGTPPTWLAPHDNNGLGWVMTSKASVSGTKSFYLNNLNAKRDSTYSFIIPEIDLGDLPNKTLTFKMAYSKTTAASGDYFRVLVSDNCANNPPKYSFAYNPGSGANATAHNLNTSDFVPAADEWRSVSVDLSAYKNIYKLGIKFAVQNKGGNNIYVDDINVTGISGINNARDIDGGISIYPNPASGNFVIKYPESLKGNTLLEAFDVTGKILGTLTFNANDGQLQVSKQNLNINKDGVYYIKMTVGGSTFTQKLVILQ